MPTSALSTRRAVATAVAMLAPALILGACSSDDAESSAAASDPAPAISIDSNLSADGAPTPSATLSPECAELQQTWAETNRALAGIDEENPRLLVAGFREANRSLTSVETPAEHGFPGMVAYLKKAVDALEDVDADDADEVASVMTLTFTDVDTTRAAAAHSQVTAYLDNGCRG
jgi:hypothetical protein